MGINHKGTLLIDSKDIILRPFTKNDSAKVYENWASDPEVAKYLTWKAHKDINETNAIVSGWVENYSNKEFYLWALELRNSGEVVGSVTLSHVDNFRESAELGIALSQKVWRTGVGTRAAGFVISHAFNVLNFKRISANHQPDNHASEKLLTKLGFKLEGVARGYTKNKDGELTDVVQYGLLKEPKVKETSRFRTDQTWKDTRNHYLKVLGKPWYQLLAELQNTLSFATFDFYNLRKIKTLHLPITTGSISSPMGKGSDSLPVKVKMFEQDVYLADSMQFMLEYGTRLFGNGAWYIMPSFRGEDNDKRHLSQFYHSEAEIPGTINDVIVLVEDYLVHLARHILLRHGDLLNEKLGDISHLISLAEKNTPFIKITLDEADDLLKQLSPDNYTSYIEDVGEFRNLTHAGERRLIEHFGGFVWVTNYDILSVPFYQCRDPNKPHSALNADLLFGIGEVVGAGERHSDGAGVRKALEEHQVAPDDYEWYIRMKEEYPVRTAGFGMGIERFLMWVTRENDIQDFQLLPRVNGENIVP